MLTRLIYHPNKSLFMTCYVVYKLITLANNSMTQIQGFQALHGYKPTVKMSAVHLLPLTVIEKPWPQV